MSYKDPQRRSVASSGGGACSEAEGDDYLDLTPHSIEFYRALPEEFARGTIYAKMKNKGRLYEL